MEKMYNSTWIESAFLGENKFSVVLKQLIDFGFKWLKVVKLKIDGGRKKIPVSRSHRDKRKV